MTWQHGWVVGAVAVALSACRSAERDPETQTRQTENATPVAGAEHLTRIMAAPGPLSREEARAADRAEAAAIRDPERRFAAHERLLTEALEENPREAVAWVLALEDGVLAAVLIDQALPAWAEVDAAAAGAHVAALPESDYRTMLAGELAAAWAARDGVAATIWAAGLGDQEAREEALRGALDRVAEKAPREAAELALRTTSEGDRAATLERMIETWWARDAEAVELWAAGLADVREKELAERLVAARKEAEDATTGF